MNLSPSKQQLLLNNSNIDPNSGMAPKTLTFNTVCPMPISVSTNNRSKLIRSTSTYRDDILDEALDDLSRLNHRHVLRQQWFRKNNLVSRLRRSTSSASNSSSSSTSTSSSSGASSSIYSNCNPNNFSFASSFSSSFSATLSSLSESCDTVDFNSSSNSFMPTNETDYPRIIRRSSFKNKFSSCYKPYYKPRRFSLQLVKNLELPESFKFCPKSNLYDLKNTMSCYTMSEKDNNCGSLYSKAAKSNPSSPSKSDSYSRGDTCITMSEDRDLANLMQTQIVITTSNPNSQVDTSQQINTNNGQVSLVRSKSLDDLNTLICYTTSLCPSSSGQDNDQNNIPNPNMISQAASHHSSFNQIAFCDFVKSNMDQSLNPNLIDSTNINNSNNSQLLYFSTAGTSANLLSTPDLAFGSYFTGANMNNQKGMSFSSNEIFSSGQQCSTTSITTGNNNANNGQQQQQADKSSSSTNQPTNNTSQCDIDNVMNKISSLRV